MFEEKEFKDWHFKICADVPVSENGIIPDNLPGFKYDKVKVLDFEGFKEHYDSEPPPLIIGVALLVSTESSGVSPLTCQMGFGKRTKSHEDLRSHYACIDYKFARCFGFVTDNGLFLTRKQAWAFYENTSVTVFDEEESKDAFELLKGGSTLYSYMVEWNTITKYANLSHVKMLEAKAAS